MRTLDDIGQELAALAAADAPPASPETCLAIGEEVLEHWVTARGAEPTHEQREGFRLLALVADQSPTRREKGLWTTFLGRPAAFHTGAEGLARSAGFPVVFARCRRVRRGHYQLRFTEIARPPYTSDGENNDNPDSAITLRYAELAERAVRDEPESWLWSNRRWKRVPADGEIVN